MPIEYRLKGTEGVWHMSDVALPNSELYEFRPYVPCPPPPMDLSGSRKFAVELNVARVAARRARDQAALDKDFAERALTYKPLSRIGRILAWLRRLLP